MENLAANVLLARVKQINGNVDMYTKEIKDYEEAIALAKHKIVNCKSQLEELNSAIEKIM